METTDARPKGLQPGKYKFTVTEVPEKRKWDSGSIYYHFVFETIVDGSIEKHEENVAVWKSAPLLRALGCKETKPDVFEWERESVVSVQFNGEIVNEKNEKNGKSYRRLANPTKINPDEENLPF